MSDIGMYTCPVTTCGEIILGESVGDPDLPHKIAIHKQWHTAEGQTAYIRKLEGALHHAKVMHGAMPSQCTHCYHLYEKLRLR